MQLPPHALTQLHESFHGVTRPSSEYRVPVDLTGNVCGYLRRRHLKVLGVVVNNGDDVRQPRQQRGK